MFKNLRSFFAPFLAFLAAFIGAPAFAFIGAPAFALSADITAAIADMKTDATTLAGAFLLVIIAVAAIKILRRAPGG